MSKVFICFGQSGIKKIAFLQKLREYINSANDGEKSFICRIIKFEDMLLNDEGKKFAVANWLSTGVSNNKKQEIWERSIEALSHDADKWPEDYIVIEMHAIYYVHGSFYYFIQPELISALNPEGIFVLMDDLVGIYKNIDTKKLCEEQAGLTIEPRDIIFWRALEYHVAEHLARHIKSPIFWLGIRSHPETFRKLLSNGTSEKYKRVYIAFPIVATRNDQTAKAEINEFRKRVYKIDNLIIFDPLAVDDLRWSKASSKLKDVGKRWPLSKEHYTLCHNLKNSESVPPGFIKNFYYIKRQIEERDLALVRQSEAMLVYRPLFNGVPAGGCFVEMGEASRIGIPIFAYCPEEDKIKCTQDPFEAALIPGLNAVKRINDKIKFFKAAESL